MAGIVIPVDTKAGAIAVKELKDTFKALGIESKTSEKDMKKFEDRLKKKMGADKGKEAMDKLTASLKLSRLEMIKLKAQSEGVNAVLGDGVKGLGRGVKGITSAFFSLKTMMGGLGLGLVAADIIRTGAQFEQSMANVKAVSGATGEQLEKLTAIARKMGEETEFSASESAEALTFLGMAGFSAEQQIAALPKTLDLATAGNLELAEAADISSNALSAMGLEVEDLQRVNDVFIATANRSNTDVRQLAEAFKYVAPSAKGLGIEIEDLNSYLGNLGNAGIQGSMAGTSLNQAFLKMPKLFKEMGVEGGTFLDALNLVNERQLTTNEVVKIFGDRGARAVNTLKDMIPKVNELSEANREASKEVDGLTESERVANEKRNTTINSWKTLLSTMEGIKLDIWEDYKGAIGDTIQQATIWLKTHKDEIKTFADGVVALVGAIGTSVAWAIEKLDDVGKKAAALGLASQGLISYADAIINTDEVLKRFERNGIEGLNELTNETVKAQSNINKGTVELEKNATKTIDTYRDGIIKIKMLEEKGIKVSEKMMNILLGNVATTSTSLRKNYRYTQSLAKDTIKEELKTSTSLRNNYKSTLKLQDKKIELNKKEKKELEKALKLEEEGIIEINNSREQIYAAHNNRITANAQRNKEEYDDAKKYMTDIRDKKIEFLGQTDIKSAEYFTLQKNRLNDELIANKKLYGDIEIAKGIHKTEMEKLTKLEAENKAKIMQKEFADKVVEMLGFDKDSSMGTKLSKSFISMSDSFKKNFTDRSTKLVQDELYNAIVGDNDMSFKERLRNAWDGLWKSMVQIVTDKVGEMVVAYATETAVMPLIKGLGDVFSAVFLHTGAYGIAEDEVPAVLQKGEMVLPKGMANEARDKGYVSIAQGPKGTVTKGATNDFLNSFTLSDLAAFTNPFTAGYKLAEKAIVDPTLSVTGVDVTGTTAKLLSSLGKMAGSLFGGPAGYAAGDILGKFLGEAIGDATNSRPNEFYRDGLEQIGFTRSQSLQLSDEMTNAQNLLKDAAGNRWNNPTIRQDILDKMFDSFPGTYTSKSGSNKTNKYGKTDKDLRSERRGDNGYHEGGMLDAEGWFWGQTGERVLSRQDTQNYDSGQKGNVTINISPEVFIGENAQEYLMNLFQNAQLNKAGTSYQATDLSRLGLE